MSRRAAAAVALAASSALVLTGCGGELVDTIESGLASEGITLPALPDGGGGDNGDAGGEQGGEVVETAPPPAETEPVPEATPVETPAATDTTDDAGSSSVPWWGWVLLVLVGLIIVGLVVSSARRRRDTGPNLAAQADGQLGWVRTNVDDPLVRWRADQLRLPVEQRDTDSELARRWALVDERVTAATTDLLTLESSGGTDTLREAAGLLRQAAEGFRASVDGLARALATGDQARIATASQGLTADTTLLDQGRQRFRQAADL